ncbi:hypothetical protein EV424DRAFT_1350097 [Suillus variegatus]|nr:hypothetical protein EV424DRAFT_1350097 [Suillus variegatus]
MSDKSGTGSTRSLRSQGPADKKAEGTGTSRKAAAIWTKEEETALLESLLGALSSSGDGGFKAPAFNAAAEDLKKKFPDQRGSVKTGTVCKNKWTSLKTLYNAVVDIKNTSGFTWSDENGAGIALKDDDVWVRYIKHHPTTKPFRTKGFSHLALMEQLVSSQGKGKYVFRPHSTRTSAALDLNPAPSPTASTTTGFIIPQTPNRNFTTMRTPDTGLLASANSSQGMDPESISPSVPSTYLSHSAGSSVGAWTSVSDTSGAKRKYSALSPESAAGSSHSKRSRPPSATLKVQQEGAESMKDLVTVVREMQKNLGLLSPSSTNMLTAIFFKVLKSSWLSLTI